MPRYRLLIDEDLKAHLKKLFKKNRSLYDAVLNKTEEILDNPKHFKIRFEGAEKGSPGEVLCIGLRSG